jgi:hypothetical protein
MDCAWVTSRGWIAAILCENDNWKGARVATAGDAKAAIRIAFDRRGDSFKFRECKLMVLIAADRSHLKYKE